MKIIALLPCKNIAWALPTYLASVSLIADEIIVIDESTDGGQEILKSNTKVKVYTNNDFLESGWDEFNIRQKLLELGRKANGTHFICLDADEAFSSNFLPIAKKIIKNLKPGQKLTMQWVFLWKTVNFFMDDKRSIFTNSYKDFIFCDKPGIQHNFSFMHVGRTPGENTDENLIKIDNKQGVCLHFAYVDWKNCLLKQAWLRCAELIKNPNNHIRINNKYYVFVDKPNVKLSAVPKEWLKELTFPQDVENLPITWHMKGILEYFDKYGIDFFEPLQIWHIKELEKEFINRIGRKPKFSRIHIYLHPVIKLKRKLFNLIK
jgi:hypothetical protein